MAPAAPDTADAGVPPVALDAGKAPSPAATDLKTAMTRRAELYEYSSMANPTMPLIPVVAHDPELHRSGPSRVEYFDLSKDLEVPPPPPAPRNLHLSICAAQAGSMCRPVAFRILHVVQVTWPATSPNLLAAFIRICVGESVPSSAMATSQAFYVIRGTIPPWTNHSSC